MKKFILASFMVLALAGLVWASAGDTVTPDPPSRSGNICADMTAGELLMAPACGEFWRLSDVSIIAGYSATLPSPLHLIVQEGGRILRNSTYSSIAQLEASESVIPLADGMKITINLYSRQVQLGRGTCDYVWMYFEGAKAAGGTFTACGSVDTYPDPLGCYSIACPAPLDSHSIPRLLNIMGI